MKTMLALVILMLAVCTYAHASDTDWSWQFGGTYAHFGTATLASDGFDSRDVRIVQTSSVYIGTYHEQDVGGWSGDTGFYSTDLRAPVTLIPGQSKTWTFYLWENPSWNVVLELMWGFDYPAPAFNKMLYTLTYVRAAQGITGGNIPVGASVLLNEHTQGTWSFPVYKTTDGRTGYMFEFTATVIPEPSSLLALVGGIAGLGGFVLRRRRTDDIRLPGR